jgi:type II secretory pathway pseudopilin PulG
MGLIRLYGREAVVPSIGFHKPPCSRGVTLIEIMIVIAIMMILMGLIMAVIGPVRRAAKERSTRLLLDGIAPNMARYHMEFDDFPIDTVNPLQADGSVIPNRGTEDAGVNDFADDGSLCLQMNSADGLGSWKSKDTPYQKRLEPFLRLQPENIRKEGTKMIIYDFFGRPIRYCNAEIFIRSSASASDSDEVRRTKEEAARKKVHSNKVDLWSLGESVTKSDDDITNW